MQSDCFKYTQGLKKVTSREGERLDDNVAAQLENMNEEKRK